MNLSDAAIQIRDQRRSVAFDSYDITVKQITDMVSDKQINVSPEYQRKFIWDEVRQSQLIESIFLGIPIPSLFMATNEDSTWEVIDGLQRLTTLVNFCGNTHTEEVGSIYRVLRLNTLEKIPSLIGATFSDLPSAIKLNFLTRPIRVTVLNDRSDYQVRFDLFQRLNTGGIVLHEQEIRNCVYQGAFNDFIKSCAQDIRLDRLVLRTDKTGRGNIEELVLKFFAYYEDRNSFQHSVKDFLNLYMGKKTKLFSNKKELLQLYSNTLETLVAALPNGIVRADRPNTTPLLLFEAVAVGAADIVASGGEIDSASLKLLLNDKKLTTLTSGGTNSKPKLLARINLIATQARK